MGKLFLASVLISLFSATSLANSACPDLTGNYEGTCTETIKGVTRTFDHKFSIQQNACSKVKVSGFLLGYAQDIGVQFVGPDNFGLGPSYRSTPSYVFDSLMFYEVFGEDPTKPKQIAIQTFKKISSDKVESLYEMNSYTSGNKLTMSCVGKKTP